ncbi:MAG: ATP-binding protein [Bacilli bacterium]|nr:ATP-binding protein [Bacilli bacterium]
MIGRKQEVERLEWAYQSPDSEFIGIYGQRRVGKTYLVAKTFAGRFAFQHAGLAPEDAEDEEQPVAEGSREEKSSLKW